MRRAGVSVLRELLGVALLAGLAGCSGPSETESGAEATVVAKGTDCGQAAGLFEQIECYADQATRAGHPKICQEAEHEGVRYQCIAILAGRLKDASLCDDIPPSSDESRALRDACLSDVAGVLEESALCGRILTPGLQDSCYYKVAGETGDTSLCERIADPGLKSGCSGVPVVVD